MFNERNNNAPQQDENEERNNENKNAERFETDAEKIIHRHLANKDDVITDEDIASVRVGMTPPMDEPTEARFENDSFGDAVEEEYLGDEDNVNDKNKDEQITPWDTVDES